MGRRGWLRPRPPTRKPRPSVLSPAPASWRPRRLSGCQGRTPRRRPEDGGLRGASSRVPRGSPGLGGCGAVGGAGEKWPRGLGGDPSGSGNFRPGRLTARIPEMRAQPTPRVLGARAGRPLRAYYPDKGQAVATASRQARSRAQPLQRRGQPRWKWGPAARASCFSPKPAQKEARPFEAASPVHPE